MVIFSLTPIGIQVNLTMPIVVKHMFNIALGDFHNGTITQAPVTMPSFAKNLLLNVSYRSLKSYKQFIQQELSMVVIQMIDSLLFNEKHSK